MLKINVNFIILDILSFYLKVGIRILANTIVCRGIYIPWTQMWRFDQPVRSHGFITAGRHFSNKVRTNEQPRTNSFTKTHQTNDKYLNYNR